MRRTNHVMHSASGNKPNAHACAVCAQVGDDPVKLARFHAIQAASDALTKGRAEYDKSIENQELNELTPRCYSQSLPK
jgi:hypothetical protein